MLAWQKIKHSVVTNYNVLKQKLSLDFLKITNKILGGQVNPDNLNWL